MRAFEGRIRAVITQGSETTPLLYTVGTKFLRIEATVTNRPNPVDILDRDSGSLTLLFPHNRSYVHLPPATNREAAGAMPLPTGIGPQSGPPGAPPVPAFPIMPMPDEKLELRETGLKTNLLGFACAQYEIKQRGETMEIWATDELMPYQPYVRNQPPRFGPRTIYERWPELLTSRKLFPLRASLRFENGAERFRFDVESVKAEKLTEADAKLFQPPTNYVEIRPLPF